MQSPKVKRSYVGMTGKAGFWWYPAFVIVGKDSRDVWTLKPFIRSVFKYDSTAVKLHSPVGMSGQKTPEQGCMLCSKAHCTKGKLSMQRKKPEYRENLINATLIIAKDPFSWVILEEKGGHATPFVKNSHVASGNRPYQKAALMGNGAVLCLVARRNCGRAVG